MSPTDVDECTFLVFSCGFLQCHFSHKKESGLWIFMFQARRRRKPGIKKVKTRFRKNILLSSTAPKKWSRETSESQYCVLSYSNWKLSKYNQFFHPRYKKLLIVPGSPWDDFFGAVDESKMFFCNRVFTFLMPGFLLRRAWNINIQNPDSFLCEKWHCKKAQENTKKVHSSTSVGDIYKTASSYSFVFYVVTNHK